MVHCCVPECTNYSKKTESVSYHKLPSKQAIQKSWIAHIKRANLPPLQYCYVCSDHFEDSCFEVDLMEQLTGVKRKRRLKAGAIPSLFNFVKPAKRRTTTENRLKRKQQQEVIEQLCAPSTSRAEVNCEEMSMKIPEFSEPLTKEIGVQCCFGYRYDVTATASTQTEPPPTQQSTDADTPKVADPSPSSNNRNEILHDHSYSSS